MPINPIHEGLLHSGKVLVIAGSENNATEHRLKISKAAVWDLGGGNIGQGKITRTPDLTWDVFCNGWAFFPDGRCLVIGGTSQYAPFTGEPRTTVFDPLTGKFCEMQNMAHGRWYATGIVLPDGRIMAFSGRNENGVVNNQVEFYTVGSGWSTPLTAPFSPNLYPWLHVLPDGRVFNSGGSPNSNMFNPATRDLDIKFCKNIYRLRQNLRKLRSAAASASELCCTRNDSRRWGTECHSDYRNHRLLQTYSRMGEDGSYAVRSPR